jgi:diacylglycerol kinase family enzyme
VENVMELCRPSFVELRRSTHTGSEMRITMILNQDGGTIRGMDAREFGDMACTRLAGRGGDCEVRLVSGDTLIRTLEEVASDPQTGTIVAGGGDGTISAAAGACFRSGKTLGVIPLGTMNLFARSLGLPLDPAEALDALVSADERPIDIATANGRPYVHQFSVGLHARLVHQRSKLDTSTRLRKISSTVKTLGRVILHPPRFGVEIDTGSGRTRQIVSAVSISNNLFGNTPLSYATIIDEGVLGVYQGESPRTGQSVSHDTECRFRQTPGRSGHECRNCTEGHAQFSQSPRRIESSHRRRDHSARTVSRMRLPPGRLARTCPPGLCGQCRNCSVLTENGIGLDARTVKKGSSMIKQHWRSAEIAPRHDLRIGVVL